MTWSIGLHLSEGLIEIAAKKSNCSGQFDVSEVLKQRTFLAKTTPAQAFQQFVMQNAIADVQSIQMVTNLPLKIAEAGHGNQIAILTTAGFENWLELNLPLKHSYFTSRPKRPSMLIDRELIFGLSERTNSQGHIEKLVSESELEFLVAKLELHEIKNVAIGFLHSLANNENELRASQFLASRGFKTYLSSSLFPPKTSEIHINQMEVPDEKERFWTAIMNAYVATYFTEVMEKLNEEFKKVLAPDGQINLGDRPLADYLDNKCYPLNCTFSLHNSLARHFAITSNLLYCGFDEFAYFNSSRNIRQKTTFSLSQLLIEHVELKTLHPNPLTQLGRSFFSDLAFASKKISLDPGPIVFGRGLRLSLLDLLIFDQQGQPLPEFVLERISERSLSRLGETLTAYSRTMSSQSSNSAAHITHELLQQARTLWHEQLQLNGRESIYLCGPLAAMVKKYISGELIGDQHFAATHLLIKDYK